MSYRRPTVPSLGVVVIVVATLVAACSSAAGSPATSTEAATPSPSVAPESPVARPTTQSPSAEPKASPALEFTPEEQALLDQIRPDARGECAPRRADLPDGATAGVECRPAGGPAAEVGFYDFPEDQAAALAYFARLAENGVRPMSGDCSLGEPGDVSWIPGDGETSLANDDQFGVVFDGSPYTVLRHGCFVAQGTANVRATCGDGVYLGVLGRTDDLAELFAWTEQAAPDVQVSVPSPPGICYFPAT